MVRNRQDGYPYINLCLFFYVVENIQKHNFFFGKNDWSMNSGPRWAGIARDIEQNYFHFQNLTKNGNKVWTISKGEITLLFSSFLHNFVVVENIQNRIFFWKSLFVNEFQTAMGGG